MLIEVTQEDIDKSERYSSCGCPVARALGRCLGYRVNVGYTAVIASSGEIIVQTLPLEVQRFISEFDAELPVKSFSFELKGTPC